MNIIFAGTPEFAQTALQHLLEAGFAVPLVLTQPDRPAGRGLKLQASPVKRTAQAHHIPVAQPRSLRLDGRYACDARAAQAAIAAAQADAMVVAAYGLILPQWVLDAPRLGCINIHASLLPRWRGAAPIHRAIEAGDTQTGITLMQMDAGLDTGAMLAVEALPIAPTDTTATLHDALATLGARMAVHTLHQAAAQAPARLPARAQPETGICYAHKIDKAQARIDWAQPASTIERRIRAFNPFPVAHTSAPRTAPQDAPHPRDETLKIWAAHPSSQPCPPHTVPGQIVALDNAGIHIACGAAPAALTTLCLTELQRAGSKRMPAHDFLRGFALRPGMVLGVDG